MRNVKWGVLGTAGIAYGQTIPGMCLGEHCELYAIAGRSAEKAQAFKEKFGFEKMYTDYDALLADPAVEAVYIPLPNTLHCEWTKKALRAKKHVLCEKPLAPTEAEARELFDVARENGVILMEAFAYLHSPLLREIKKELDSGVIGKPLFIENEFMTSDYADNIRMERSTNGGSVYDLGCYCTSQVLTLLGREPEDIRVIADMKNGIDLFASGLMTFEGGARAAFSCGFVLATDKDRRIDRLGIYGTEGCIRTSAEYNQCGELRYTVTVGDKTDIKVVSTPNNYMLEAEQLSRCIAEGEKPFVTEEFTYANARTVGRILDSIGY